MPQTQYYLDKELRVEESIEGFRQAADLPPEN